MQKQAQLWNEIKSDRRITHQIAVARAEKLKKTEEAGVAIRAARGNRAQVRRDRFSLPISKSLLSASSYGVN